MILFFIIILFVKSINDNVHIVRRELVGGTSSTDS